MTLKLVLTASILALAPMAGFSQCSGHSDTQAMTCAQGSVYDADTGQCKVVTG
ncbi:MAG: adenylosuccinate lyase [Roseivivax sp.]|nr:adenylosuccinate lyase [Roseivivax sp.]